MDNYTMLRWLVIFVSSLLTTGLLYHKGVFHTLWTVDISGLSFVILSIYWILSCFIGVISHRLLNNPVGSAEYSDSSRYVGGCWYASELLMAIGMMGTLIGFMIMLGPALAGLDPNNLVVAKDAIFKMASGMSTAVASTLVGLITSQLIKLQLINLEIGLDDSGKTDQ